MSLIEVNNYFFSYENNPDKYILKGVSFSVERQTIATILGLSGCGKTTLCRSLCGIIPNLVQGNSRGDIFIDGKRIQGEPLPKLVSKVGLVMQDPDDQLVCSTVEDELAFAPENLALPPQEIRQRVEAAIRLLQLEEMRWANPNQLSGGQKQMVAIASILTLNPEIIILDEPMSHLDAAGRERIKHSMLLLKEQGKTLLVVEHNYNYMRFADQWIILSNGKVVNDNSPEQILTEKKYELKSGAYHLFL